MLVGAWMLLVSCGGDDAEGEGPTPRPVAEARPSGPRPPLSTQVALLKVRHAAYEGHALYVDGRHRGPLPADLVLNHGDHVFEIETDVGRKVFARTLEPGAGIRVLDLAADP